MDVRARRLFARTYNTGEYERQHKEPFDVRGCRDIGRKEKKKKQKEKREEELDAQQLSPSLLHNSFPIGSIDPQRRREVDARPGF